ncbi:serine/threonine protein kinase [Streptomyces sp. NBC_00104]|uniref:serine/threonine-protein kinase n=1 Tax=Streptomyces sp. NBC_00104 TaxID=2903621 RepID=UPI0032485945
MMVLLWTVLSCAVAVTAGAFLQPQLRLAAGAVADWGAYSLDLIASALENAADTCGHVTAAARHGIARGGWPVWPLIAAAIALAGAFFFVRGEFTLVESSAAAIIAPDTLDAGGSIVEAGPQNREMAESIAWVFVGGTVVLGGLPFVLARDDTDRIGPLARQTPGVRHTVTVAVLGLCVIAVLCSVALGMFRAEQSVGGREITTVAELAAYSAGGGTAAITSVGSLAVGWALDYVLMGVWLLFVAVSELALHIAALGARITADAAQRNARIVTPAAVDALGRLGSVAFRQETPEYRPSTESGTWSSLSPPDEQRDDDAADFPLRPGSVVAGRWRLVGQLPGADKPGFAAVGGIMLCQNLREPATTNEYVIKFVARDREGPGAMGRKSRAWRREVRTAAKIDSPHTVKIVDFGIDDDWQWTVTPRYVPGSLFAYGRDSAQARTLEWVLVMGEQLLAGLEAIHDRDVAHLDIKPQNVLLSWRDMRLNTLSAAFTDFGLAKQFTDSSVSFTGHFQGTPYYAAFEQLTMSQEKDGRSLATDIYQMGSLMYWLLSGQPALAREVRARSGQAEAIFQLYQLMQENHRPARLDALLPGLPKSVVELVDQWLAYEPAQRTGGPAKSAARDARRALSQIREHLRATRPRDLTMPVGPIHARQDLPLAPGDYTGESDGPTTDFGGHK